MHLIIKEKNQARFYIEYKNNIYKLFYYFIQGDFSIGIGDYYGGTHTARKDIPFDSKISLHDNLKNNPISISEASKTAVNDVIQKTSYHQSGIIVSKNKKQERTFSNKDIYSIPFSEIKETIQLCAIYPAPVVTYPLITNIGKKKCNIIKLSEDKNPVMIKIHVTDKNCEFVERYNEKYPDAIIYQDSSSLRDIGKVIYVIAIKSNNKLPPSDHVFCSTIY